MRIPVVGLERSLHLGADVGRDLGEHLSLHAVAGVTRIDGPEGSLDPYAWRALRWAGG